MGELLSTMCLSRESKDDEFPDQRLYVPPQTVNTLPGSRVSAPYAAGGTAKAHGDSSYSGAHYYGGSAKTTAPQPVGGYGNRPTTTPTLSAAPGGRSPAVVAPAPPRTSFNLLGSRSSCSTSPAQALADAEVLIERSGPPPSIANVGPRESLQTLAEEFKYNASFVARVKELAAKGYTGWRRVRGDGNCCYRAAGFALLEQLVALGPRDSNRAKWTNALLMRLKAVAPAVASYGGSAVPAHEALVARVEALASGRDWDQPMPGAPVAALYKSMREPVAGGADLDLALIRALRQMAAQFIRQRASDESVGGGISFDTISSAQGYKDAADFCSRVVSPLGYEAEGIILTALAKSMGVTLRIAFLDRRDSTDLVFCDYEAGDNSQSRGWVGGNSATPVLHLQFRPGHYDVLYYRTEIVSRT